MSKFRTNIFLIATNVWVAENLTEHSSNTLLRLVRFYFELLMVLIGLQISEFLKFIILFSHYFWRQRSVTQNELKNTYINFATFHSKINKFEQKKSEINEKNLKVAGNYPNI